MTKLLLPILILVLLGGCYKNIEENCIGKNQYSEAHIFEIVENKETLCEEFGFLVTKDSKSNPFPCYVQTLKCKKCGMLKDIFS